MNTTPGLILRAALWMAVLRVLKFAMPLPRLVALVQHGVRPHRRRPTLEARTVAVVDRVASAFRLDGQGHCLERSLTMFRLLRQAGAVPRLVIGLKRADDRVGGHAWIMVDGVVVGETGIDDYATIISFDVVPS